MRRALRLLIVCAMLAPAVAHAQDDWSLDRPGHHDARPQRGPRSPRRHVAPLPRESGLIERYRAMVMRDPSETFALARWVTLQTERDGSTELLRTEMQAAATGDAAAIPPRLVLAYLARRAGRLDDARALYREIDAAHPDDPIGPSELARTEREAGALEAARAAYEIGRSRAHGDAAASLAHEELEVLVDQGDVEAARALDATLAGPRPSVERRLELPRTWLAHQRPEAAARALAEIEARVAGDPRALLPVRMERARAELALGNVTEALRALDALLPQARGGVRVEAYALAYEAHRQASSLDVLAAQLGHEHAPEAMALLARLEDERGHDEAAIAAYDRAIRARPRDATLRERRAHVLLRIGRIDEAAAGLEALWRASPDEPDRLIEAATILVDAGRADDARALLASASASRGRDVRLHQRLVEVLARWGDDAGALAEAQTLARLEPNDAEHHALVGDLLLARGDRTGALAAFRRMLVLDPSAAGHDRLGMTLADHDLLDDARAELTESLRLAPDDRAATQHLVDILVRAGRDADAEPLATRLVTLSAGDPARLREARTGLVSIWARRRTLDRHVELLEGAFAASPPDLAAGALLAEALRRSASLARAEEVLTRLASLTPEDAETWTTLERIRTLRGDLAGAIDALDHAVHADPPRAASYLARMSEDALALYRDDDAIRYAEAALALSPNDAHGHVRLGDLHRRRQQTTEAVASYRRALALDASLAEVALMLGELTRESGDVAGADALYAQVIEQSPDDDLVTRAIDASLEIELARGDAEPLLDRLLTLSVAHYDRPVLARSALAVLDAIARPLLARADGEPAVQANLHRIAARGLGVLLRALASSDPSEQRTALSILAAARLETASTALLAASQAHRDGTFGVEALLAAARVVSADQIPHLVEIARGTDVQRARIATWGITRIGDRDAARALAELALEGTDIGALAALGLAHLGQDVGTLRLPARGSAILLALAAAGHPPTPAECTALSLSGGQARAVAMLTCADDPLVARTIMAGTDAPSTTRAVRHVASDLEESWPEPRVGETSLTFALRAIDEARGRPATPSMRAAIARAVRDGLRSSTAGLTLRQLAVEGDHLALSGFGPDAEVLREAEDAILADLPVGDGDPLVRAAVARLLAQLRPDDERLVALLSDGDREVIRATLEGLGARATISPSLAEPLAAILRASPDWVARLAAARALGRAAAGGDSALASALTDDDFAFVREQAALALAARSEPAGLAALRSAAAGDPEERVRAAASSALEARGDTLR